MMDHVAGVVRLSRVKLGERRDRSGQPDESYVRYYFLKHGDGVESSVQFQLDHRLRDGVALGGHDTSTKRALGDPHATKLHRVTEKHSVEFDRQFGRSSADVDDHGGCFDFVEIA